MLWLRSHTGGAGLAVVLDEGAEERPSIVVTDELKGLVLAEVSGDRVVMFVEKDAESEVIEVRDVDVVLVLKKSFRVSGQVRVGWICEVVRDLVSGLSRFDVRVKCWMSMMGTARRMGTLREVARRDNANCSLVKTGRKLCGFTVA